MVGEKKKTGRKASSKVPAQDQAQALSDKVSLSAIEKKRVARKASSQAISKASPGSQKSKVGLSVRRKARGASSSSALSEMALEKEGSLLTTRTSAPSSRSRATAGAHPGKGKEKIKEKGKEKGLARPSLKGYWQGQMLLASPAIGDQRFERSVIYLCHQGEDGALGLVVNKIADKIQFTDVLDHLDIPFASSFERISVHVGGPVESSRGFVLHSPEKMFAGTIGLGDLAMTASADILKQIAEGKGPKEYVFLLGYAGWGTGQLDKEIERNAWLHLPFDRDLVFGEDDQDKWSRAMQKLGVSPHLLSGEAGNA